MIISDRWAGRTVLLAACILLLGAELISAEVTNIRLVNGGFPFQGTVEILYNNTWGTICHYYFDMEDAEVVCRMLGYPGAINYLPRARFGQGSGPVWLDDLKCIGNETSIGQCSHSPFGDTGCRHDDDAGVVCKTTDRYIKDVRLVNGGFGVPYQGRVEILLNDTWGTINGYTFDIEDAEVICRMLGYPGAKVPLTILDFGQGTGPIWMDDVRCRGDESSIEDCTHDGFGFHERSEYENDADVVCRSTDKYVSDIRLVNGGEGMPFRGTVEVLYNNTWGNICGWAFGTDEAAVVCRMLGYPGAVWGGSSSSSHGSGQIWMKDVRCHGDETDIGQCSHQGFGQYTCTGDAGLVFAQCSTTNRYVSDVRLVNMKEPFMGIVEILYNNTWGTICNLGSFKKEEAALICRMLGYSGAVDVVDSAHFGDGSGPIWMYDVSCTGDETSIGQCYHNGFGNTNICTHKDDVGVICWSPDNNYVPKVRLVNGGVGVPFQGTVEIFYNNTWGTICDDWFDTRDAEVICRMLGYPGAVDALPSAHFGQGSGPIWLNDLKCTGEELGIGECKHNGFANHHDCTHKEDAGVICKSKDRYVSDVRLVHGAEPFEGTVEILYEDTWGTICGDSFDMQSADVVCRMLGHTKAIETWSFAHFGQGSGPIWMEDVKCTGDEVSIGQCSHNGFGHHDCCSHRDDVGIRCLPAGSGESTTESPITTKRGTTTSSPYTEQHHWPECRSGEVLCRHYDVCYPIDEACAIREVVPECAFEDLNCDIEPGLFINKLKVNVPRQRAAGAKDGRAKRVSDLQNFSSDHLLKMKESRRSRRDTIRQARRKE